MKILLVSTADWDHPFWTNKQHVTMALAAEGHQVLYVESLGIRTFSKESVHDSKRVAQRLKRFISPPRSVAKGVHVASPLVVPIWSNKFVVALNHFFMRLQMSMWRYRWGNWDAVWTYSPITLAAIEAGSAPLLYHCVDNISAQPSMPRQAIDHYETKLVERADLIYATAPELTERLLAMGAKHVEEHTNVVDFEHFSKVQSRGKGTMACESARIGFVGALSSYKVDVALVKKVADTFPSSEIYLVGQVGEGQPGETLDELRTYKNIVFAGPRDYAELPALIASFDVALLPVPINEYTKSMFPMKFFEYLACGVPVVSTAIPSLSNFKKYAFFSNSHDEFVENVSSALSVSEDSRRAGRELAALYTYKRRTSDMTSKLQLAVAG